MRQVTMQEVRDNLVGFLRSIRKEGAIIYRMGYPIAVVVEYDKFKRRAYGRALEEEFDEAEYEARRKHKDWRDIQAELIGKFWEDD